MGNLEAALVDVRDVPELAKLGKPGLKQPDRRGIMIHLVDFTFQEGNGYVRLGCDARIDTAVSDVGDFNAAPTAVLQKANPVVRRLAADMEVHPERRHQGGKDHVWLFRAIPTRRFRFDVTVERGGSLEPVEYLK